MKLHPPTAIIDEKDPFKNALFERKAFAKSLSALLRHVSDGLVVFVNAPWGEGKSTFARMWQAQLRQEKLESIYYDAYAADYSADPFVSFSGEILALAKRKLPRNSKARNEFKKTAGEVGRRLAGVAVKGIIKAATLGGVDGPQFEEIKKIGADAISDTADVAADLIEKKIENYSVEKNAFAKFKESLAEISALIRKQQGFPLTIIVDELDRCRPDFALGLLERIKHLFDVEGIAFVLLVNQEQIESYVKSVYGTDVDARAYLLKFATLFVDLPNNQHLFRHAKGRSDYCKILFDHQGLGELSSGAPDYSLRGAQCCAEHFELTLREIEKAFGVMAIFYASMLQNGCADPFLVSLLSILKVKKPSLYQKLKKGNVSIDDFLKDTGMDQMSSDALGEINQDWVTNLLRACLMTKLEFQMATQGNLNPHDPIGLNRMRQSANNKTIPDLCRRLDQFSFSQGNV